MADIHSQAVTIEKSLRPFLQWMTERHLSMGGLTEIRLLGGGVRGVYSGLVGPADVDDLIAALLPKQGGEGHPRIGESNIYFGLNPVRPIAGLGSRVQRALVTAKDRDVLAYSMFVVDVDPERSPRDRSASDDEKEAALQVTEAIRTWFLEYGIRSLFADSGNGFHLLIPLIPKIGSDITQTAQRARKLLNWLDQQFSNSSARVDTSTFNPARIFKLYGTLAKKGTHSEEYPHRWSSIDLDYIPNDIDLFERLGTLLVMSPTKAKPIRQEAMSWDVWRKQALQQLPLVRVYGAWLTGAQSGAGWLQCRDPESTTGDQNPSAGVVDGSGEAERGSFHSFRSGVSESVFDFLIRIGQATDFRQACEKVADWSGVLLPRSVDLPKQIERPRTIIERPVVDFIVNIDTVEEFFVRILEAVRPFHRLFRAERDMVFVRRGFGPITVTEKNIGGLILALTELRLLRDSGEGTNLLKHTVLPSELARAFVSSPKVNGWLPLLHQYTRAPLFDRDWRWVGQPGYHADSGTYYDGPKIEPCRSTTQLDLVLAEFHWKEDVDRVNFIGALLTALTMPHWGRGHPFLAINGNKPGVGKSTLARLLGVVVDGIEPHTVSYLADEAEFEKQLATRVEAGDRIVIIDNAKTQRPIESPVLERCITDTRLNFRRLGSNTAITRSQNDLLFCLTMNLVQLGPDLRRRALPIHLEFERDVRGTHYRIDDLIGWTLEHRRTLVAELVGMVMSWLEAGKPEVDAPASHSMSQIWAATMDAILRHAGFTGFLRNMEASEHAFDVRFPLVMDIAREFSDKPAMTPTEWVPLLEGILEERFRDNRGGMRSLRSKATIVGTLFADYIDRRLELEGRTLVVYREPPQGARRSPAYGFRPVA